MESKYDKETNERCRFFQTVQAWPLSKALNYDGWLSNFTEGNDRDLACLILDFFTYYPDNMINELLKSAISNAGRKLSSLMPEWKHSDFNSRCYYSFIPGETQNPTDSGHVFVRRLRDEIGIQERRIIDYKTIPTVLEREPGVAVILVDDFVGSGAQCVKAWNNNYFDGSDKTLKETAVSGGHIFIYAPLIANYKGYERIIENCDSLILSPAHVLGEEYDLFNPKCYCWKNDPSLYTNGVDMILRKSKELKIPSTNGKSTQDEKGFGAQGLAIAFGHGAPDAIPAFFYWCESNWKPLIQKRYERKE